MKSICQLYVPSFFRSYGNNAINVITYILPKLKETGFSGIYLIGLFQDGGYDNGFDIVSYDVNSKFGTNDDLVKLINTAHEQKLEVGVDVVPNHVSDKHILAQKCLAGVPGYEDALYVVSEEEAARLTENGVPSFFGKKAYSKVNGKYVRTTFVDDHQLNLNWNSISVQTYFARLFTNLKAGGIDFARIDCGMMLLEDVSKADKNNPVACMNPIYSVDAIRNVAGDLPLFFEWFDPASSEIFNDMPNCYALDCSYVMGVPFDFANWNHPHMVPLLGGHDQMTAADRGIDVDEAIAEASKHEYAFLDMQTLLRYQTDPRILPGDEEYDADLGNVNQRYRARREIRPVLEEFMKLDLHLPSDEITHNF